MISIVEQLDQMFGNGRKVSGYIPSVQAVENICDLAMSGNIFGFIKLYRIVTFGEVTSREECDAYFKAFDIYGQLEARYLQDYRSLELLQEQHINEGFYNEFSRTSGMETYV